MTEPTTRDLTRRDVLRRGAAAGALVWSVPVIESLTVPAGASNGSPFDESLSYVGLRYEHTQNGRRVVEKIKFEFDERACDDGASYPGIETCDQPNNFTNTPSGDCGMWDGSSPSDGVVTYDTSTRSITVQLPVGVTLIEAVVKCGSNLGCKKVDLDAALKPGSSPNTYVFTGCRTTP